MARVTVVGTGYVGTVTAVCLALLDHDVVGLDIDRFQAEQLAAGQMPFYELGMSERLEQALESGRLSFTSDPATAVENADVIFLCVGTPSSHSGIPEMSQVEEAVRSIAPHLKPDAVIVNKSTVPVGSGNWVRTMCWRLPESPQACLLKFPTLGDTPPGSFGPGRLPPMLPGVTVRQLGGS